jgi:RNA polymerase sigma factor (sigma-70 family)
VNKRERTVFEILVRENTSMLTAYLGSLLVDKNSVDDLFQEVMIEAWRRHDDCDLSKPFGPWLRGIASRVVMAEHRRGNKVPQLLSDEVRLAISEQFENIDSKAGDTWEQRAAAVRECIDALSVDGKKIVLQRYLDGQSAREIATSRELQIGACKKLLQRARGQLVQCLQSRGLLLSEVLSHE